MKVALTLNAASLSDERRQELAREFCSTLNEETEISARLPEAEAPVGEKGEPITIGLLLLAFMTSGTAVALFEVAKAYFERNAQMSIDLERPDGRKITIAAENLQEDQIDRALTLVQEFIAE